MAVEIDAIQSAKSIGWTDALLSRLAANSVGLGARLSITAPANASALSTTGYSLTGSNAQSMIDLAGTWNTTGTPTLIKANVTDTASNASSLFMDLQNGGVTQFNARKDGVISVANSYTTTSVAEALRNNIGLRLGSGSTLAWCSAASAYGTADIIALRDAANTLALRNAANAQAFNIYNTYTSGSVYERGFMRWVSNVLEIGTEHVGASGRAVRFQSSNTSGDGFHFRNTSQSAWTITFTTSDRNCQMYVQSQRLDMSGGWGSLIDYSAGASNNHTLLSRSNNGSTTFFGLTGSSAGVMQLNNGAGKGSGYGAALELNEMTSPAAPATNGVYIFAEDNGGGKTRLMARFATGATQQLAIEP